MDRLTACLILRLLPGIGPITAQKLVHAYGSPEAIFDPQAKPIEAPSPHLIAILKQAGRIHKKAKQIKKEIADAAINCLVWGTPSYQIALASCPDAPLILFYKGNFKWENRKWIAIVGNRNPTRYGRDNCEALINALTPYNPVIVSGMAYGIDILAHKTAMESGLDTVACLPHALEMRLYPAAHENTANKMLQHGALVSDFLAEQGFEKGNFVQRNRLIAGLSQATIVIESGRKGGSLITAQFAQQYDRDVFAIPGSIQSEKSQGCHTLIQQNRAILLDSTEILLASLGWAKKGQVIQRQLPLELPANEHQVYELLLQQGRTSLDTLSQKLNWRIAETAVVLMQLEMKKLVRPLPAKYFEAV